MESLKILQLTDFHLFGKKNHEIIGIYPYKILEKIMATVAKEIKHQKPDLVLLTGDLSQDNSLESYLTIREMCQIFSCPIAATMGNHDNPAAFQEIFGDAYKKYFSFEKWRILMLNSHWPGHVAGMLDDKELHFLQQTLARDEDKYALIVLHHHVINVGCFWLDHLALKNAASFLDIINQHKNIKIVLCGHVHQENIMHYNNIDFITTPSTSWQFAKLSLNFKLDSLMPGYRWLELFPDGTYKTQVTRLDFNPQFVPDLGSQGY